MPSYTTWTRLEPRTRNESMTDGLRATIHDPLWFLGRQGQVSEFEGEDAGAPIVASYEVDIDLLDRYTRGPVKEGATSNPYDGTTPLEVLIEQERIATERETDSDTEVGSWERAVESGQHFLRLLATDRLAYKVRDFPDFLLKPSLEFDDDSGTENSGTAPTSVLAGRTLDGVAFYQAAIKALPDKKAVPRPVGLKPGEEKFEAYIDAVIKFVSWYESLYSEPDSADPSSWDDNRFEYRFAVSTGAGENESVFEVQEHANGRLNWHAFEYVEDTTLSANSSKNSATETIERIRVPTGVEYSGMPAARWWEFENGVNLAQLDVAPEDLSRLLLLEFALIAGNDWFVLPLALPTRSLARIRNITVTDNFGETVKIDSAQVHNEGGMTDWNMYGFSLAENKAGLFLPPVLSDVLESEPVETVEFVRDELANIGWAVEEQVEGQTGDPVQRAEVGYRPPLIQDTDPQTEMEVTVAGLDHWYRLSTDVPNHWYPLLPTIDRDRSGSVVLEVGELLGEDGQRPPPQGRILSKGTHQIPEEEISSEGTTVTRSYQYARGSAGGTYLWSGRRKAIGTKVGSSGLTFDTVERTRTIGATGTDSHRLAIRAIYPKSPRDDLTHERIVFENVSSTSLELGGWTVTNERDQKYRFSAGVSINAGERITLRSSQGIDEVDELYWGAQHPIWNHDGDTVFVYNGTGKLIVKRSY
jgi:hypothetical protein